LYTFVTNKKGKSKQGTLVAVIRGTLSKDIITTLMKLSEDKRLQVKEVTLDMAKNMEAAVKEVFKNASLVTDRFHVIKLAMEALQHTRIKLRWKELDKENEAIKKAREQQIKYQPNVVVNGETPKQLLARGKYVIAKKPNDWTENQQQRANLLFKQYPNLKIAYDQTLAFRNIYENKQKAVAKTAFEEWIQNVQTKDLKEFYTVANTVKYNLDNILNFFDNRNTNANAESFNSKIKLFRANQRGVTDTKFFLFRLHKLFA
jgi:transposase